MAPSKKGRRRRPKRTALPPTRLQFEHFVTLMMIDPTFRRSVASDPEKAFKAHNFEVTDRLLSALKAVNYKALSRVYRAFRGEADADFIS